jgi:predicted DCC family thiol-disulfide oxidoreductase YuxK
MGKKEIIIVDGKCVLCNSITKWLIKKDKNKIFEIASLESEYIKKNFQNIYNVDSVAVVDSLGNVFQKSLAILYILKKIDKLFWIQILIRLLPLFLTNFFYDLIAKTRYKIFGKYDQCMINNNDY